MTNLAMQYINYPAKTLMKSSRVVFTMLFGVVIARKVYKTVDYVIVMGMVAGLALFMHADANSSAVFDWAGVAMLTVSLLCDGAISNMSETIMNRFGVGQDEFIFRMYSIALVAITIVAAMKGDLREGLVFMSQPGSYGPEMALPVEQRTWSVPGKVGVMVLFSSMGFFGSSCSAAITKNFGALTMSITSTARKATTLFLSFFLFNNVCTLEHLFGVFVFISALTAKSLRRGNKKSKRGRHDRRPPPPLRLPIPVSDLETRALHLGSDNVHKTAVNLDQMEEGHVQNGRGGPSVSPPTSVMVCVSESRLTRPGSRMLGTRQRTNTTPTGPTPVIQVL
jgi:adenosine 3'-phospho 5'-phosphosulfate transporter B3